MPLVHNLRAGPAFAIRLTEKRDPDQPSRGLPVARGSDNIPDSKALANSD